MDTLNKRIIAFDQLGAFLAVLVKNQMKALSVNELKRWTNKSAELNALQNDLLEYYHHSIYYNPWFTKENVLFALKDWANALQKEKLQEWLSEYNLVHKKNQKTIGVVMAGNLPLVGYHDYLCIIISGHKVMAKLSSDDAFLLPLLHKIVSLIEPKLLDKAEFTKNKLKDFDAIIATGSDNTSRYFEYYFGKYPHIIRKNRSGVAILNGKESDKQLHELSVDLTAYFGLGCRSISKLYVPKAYEFRSLFENLDNVKHIAQHHKFFNNYEYNKAIFLVNKVAHRDIGFLLFTEEVAMSSPISVVYYEEYEDSALLEQQLQMRKTEIQCIIGAEHIAFGQSQHPNLNDYADGVDVLAFLENL